MATLTANFILTLTAAELSLLRHSVNLAAQAMKEDDGLYTGFFSDLEKEIPGSLHATLDTLGEELTVD